MVSESYKIAEYWRGYSQKLYESEHKLDSEHFIRPRTTKDCWTGFREENVDAEATD